MPPIYLILPTLSFGGAEKRFLGLFQGLAREVPHLRLVAARPLIELAQRSEEFSVLREPLGERLVMFEAGGLRHALRRCFWAAPRAVFHYVLVPPPLVHWFPSRRVLFTIPLSGVNLYNARGRASLYAGALASARTDFLDQGVYEHVVRRLPFLRHRFSVTPSSFVDLDYYQAPPAASKDDRVVFLGLLSPEKQAMRLMDHLPAVARLLGDRGFCRVAFGLYGQESGQLPTVAERSKTVARTVDVECGFQADPRQVLSRAKVFLSLQRNTNYPSKSLLEGLACGALPVITDVADSRRMVPEDVAQWIPRDFSAEDIAGAVVSILSLTPEEHDRRVGLVRSHLHDNFSFRAMAVYYQQLWTSLEESA